MKAKLLILVTLLVGSKVSANTQISCYLSYNPVPITVSASGDIEGMLILSDNTRAEVKGYRLGCCESILELKLTDGRTGATSIARTTNGYNLEVSLIDSQGRGYGLSCR